MFPIRATDKSQITQGYGKTPFASTAQGQALYKNFGGIHPGIDIGTYQVNLECLATQPGKVVRAGWDGGWGNHIEIQGSDGWNRQYAHLQSINNLKVGDIVKAGDVIGRVGTTGGYWKVTSTGKVWIACSTGIHLHYGNRKLVLGKWQYRDPGADFQGEIVPQATMPTKKFIKDADPKQLGIYFYDGEKKYPLTTWDTFKVLSGGTSLDVVELVGADVLSKIPQGDAFPKLSTKLLNK